MELIDVPVVGRGSVVVAHSATGLTRGLERGESVVVRGPDGAGYAARVTDIEFELDDTVYRLELGRRLPLEQVVEGSVTAETFGRGLDRLLDEVEGIRQYPANGA